MLGSVYVGEVDNPLLMEFPDVWRHDGRKLLPADGVDYLEAVHEVMAKGKLRWTEKDFLSPGNPRPRSNGGSTKTR